MYPYKFVPASLIQSVERHNASPIQTIMVKAAYLNYGKMGVHFLASGVIRLCLWEI